MSSGIMESLLQVLDWKVSEPSNITVSSACLLPSANMSSACLLPSANMSSARLLPSANMSSACLLLSANISTVALQMADSVILKQMECLLFPHVYMTQALCVSAHTTNVARHADIPYV